jgi:aerobic-type carbon monoxide dehydrogenase small subunit (CoxS/CutS family)
MKLITPDMEQKIRFKLNGKATVITTDPNQTLLWVLRNQLGLTGTKYGCGTGFCGSCTVLVNKEATRSCMLPVTDIEGKEVITIEGLGKGSRLHPLQQAFIDNDALQCGFCTPGMIMTAAAMLLKNPSVTREEIVKGLDENLCRCGAHPRIIDAVETAAKQMKGGK